MTLWDRIHRIVFGAPEDGQNEEVLAIPVKKDQIQLAVYFCPYEKGPIASVRYTCYAEDGKPLNVEQINYGSTPESLAEFDLETTRALEMGVDVTIFTRVDIGMFPYLSKFTKGPPKPL